MVRILHLSDLHFALDAQANNMQTVLLREAGAVQGLSRHEKLLIVTGDFHNFKDSDYGKAEEFLKKLFTAMDIDPAEGVFVIPGNHDVGNDASLHEQIKVEPNWKRLQKSALDDLKCEQPEDWQDSLYLRLKCYKPYCDFVRRLGIYPAGDDFLPAQVHVRCWDSRLNILHLNTTLIYEPKKYGNQKLDALTATGEEIWRGYDPVLPTLALGHNSYYDLCEAQRHKLRVPFFASNISAYLCGDTHRKETNPEHQTIPLQANQLGGVRIPNVVCAKGVSDENDTYSDFGFYWHDWDTETDAVKFQFWRWRPEYGAEVQPDGKADSYPLRKPGEAKAKPAAPAQVHSHEPDILHQYLDDRLEQVRRGHPSFTLMKRDELDERLFPEIKSKSYTEDWQDLAYTASGTRRTDGEAGPVWELIAESWVLPENHSIVIEGDGGIGKTVTLLTPPRMGRHTRVPALYVPLYKLFPEEGNCLTIKEYLQKQQTEHIEEIGLLASRGWNHGPTLLLLLDGFNEISLSQQNEAFEMLKDWSEAHPGAQMIAVSRPLDGGSLSKRLPGDPIGVELAPQTCERVEAILRENEKTVPPADSELWDVLRYPLFLTLYMKADRLESVMAYGYALKPRPEPTRSALIWNYLQRELLKKNSEKWVFRCALCCEYILPYVAFAMVERGRLSMTRKEIDDIAKQAMSELNLEALPAHLGELFDAYNEKYGAYPTRDFLIREDVLWSGLGLLVQAPARKNSRRAAREYSFPHQSFRDCLAGLHLVNAAEEIQNNKLPVLWWRTAHHLALDYAAELMAIDTAKSLWEANRVQQTTDSAALYAQLELHRHRAGVPMELNFSGMDLRGLSLARYGNQGERDLKLFRKQELSKGTRFDIATFCGQGHTGPVSCLAVSGNSLVVSGSYDNSLRVWDLRAGDCLRELKGHNGLVSCVATTVDGLAVSGSHDNNLRVWNLRSEASLYELKGHTRTVSSVAVTSDGIAVSGSYDRTLRVWDLSSRECLHVLKGHTGSVSCVAVTDDGLAVSGSPDGTLRVWDWRSGDCLKELKGHNNKVSCVVVTDDGLAVSGSWDNTLRIWDLRSGDCLNELKGHSDPISCVTVTAEGLAVSGSYDNSLRVWNLRSGDCLRELKGHTGWIHCVILTESDLAVSASDDNSLRVWDLRSGDCLHELKGHTDSVFHAATTVDGLAVSGSYDSSLRVWDLRSGCCLRTLKGHTGRVTCASITVNGIAISGSDDNSLRVWDLGSGTCLHELKGHTSRIGCLAVTADNLAVSGSYDNSLRIWDLNSGACLHELKGHSGWISCAATTADNFAVSGSGDYSLRVWDLCSGAFLHELKGHTSRIGCVAVTADGLAVSGSDDKSLRVWDLHSGDCLRELKGHTGRISCLTVTEDGLAISGSYDNSLRIWDLYSGDCLRELKGHSDSVSCVAVTADGLAVSGSYDNGLRIWDLHSGDCLHELKGHTDAIRCIAVTEGGLAVSGSDDGSLRVWDLHSGSCLDVLYTLYDIDVSQMRFSRAKLDYWTARALWQNGARLSDRERRAQETARQRMESVVSE